MGFVFRVRKRLLRFLSDGVVFLLIVGHCVLYFSNFSFFHNRNMGIYSGKKRFDILLNFSSSVFELSQMSDSLSILTLCSMTSSARIHFDFSAPVCVVVRVNGRNRTNI